MPVVIEARNLSKTYESGTIKVEALKDINLIINKGEYLSLIGASGSGKSTLMNLFGCLDTPTSGAYFLNAFNTGKLSDDKLAEIRNNEIGFVFQTFNLIPRLNALENVELPLIYAGLEKEKRRSIALKVIDQVGLADRIKHKPAELSGGQRQRVAIARALVNKPSIILADEPTGNLDSKTSGDIMQLFNELHKLGNTIIIVTHELEIAEKTQRIIALKDGRILSDLKTENSTG